MHPRFFCLSLVAEDGLSIISVMKRIHSVEDQKGKNTGREDFFFAEKMEAGSGKRKTSAVEFHGTRFV
jgi:hypothetical protein